MWLLPIKALADESEFVRDTALRAGQRIVHMFAETSVSVFLPELEKGLFDDNWRIRYSSVQLLGDLLYRVSGVTGKQSTVSGEDDNFGTEQSTKVRYFLIVAVSVFSLYFCCFMMALLKNSLLTEVEQKFLLILVVENKYL